jgi:hypothetical protein
MEAGCESTRPFFGFIDIEALAKIEHATLGAHRTSK